MSENGSAPLRIYVTDSWGTFDFDLTNLTDTDRRGRVVVFYQGRPDVEYGRDVWVPARSTVRSWLLVGPAPVETPGSTCDVEFLLYDRTDGADRLIRPRGEERVRSRGVIYRKREPFTAVLQALIKAVDSPVTRYLAIWPGMTVSGTRTRKPMKWRPVRPGCCNSARPGPAGTSRARSSRSFPRRGGASGASTRDGRA